MQPGGRLVKFTGREHVRSIGAIWYIAEGQGQLPGNTTDTTLMTIGYDPARGRYVGTWIGSMMSTLWVYDGEVNADGRVLTLHSEGPSMAGDGKTARYKDVIEFRTDDHRVFTAHVQRADGTWQQMMAMDYRRQS